MYKYYTDEQKQSESSSPNPESHSRPWRENGNLTDTQRVKLTKTRPRKPPMCVCSGLFWEVSLCLSKV